MSLTGVQERVLQQVQAMVSVALQLGPHHPGDPMILELISAGTRCHVEFMENTSKRITK